jgi:neutral ceramidase
MLSSFAEIDITPPLPILKIGMLKEITASAIHDPLYARVALFADGDQRIAFIQLDWLSVRWTTANDIRQRIERAYGFCGGSIMVSATHNHAGPAVANVGMVARDEGYVETAVSLVVKVFGSALENLQEAHIGFGHVNEFEVAYNRRLIMRDGTARCHALFSDPDALCFEGPVDPEVAVIAARTPDGRLLGCMVNFACHPTHLGDGTEISAGIPGALAAKMRERGCPVTLFLNGACGNTHTLNPMTGTNPGAHEAGQRLADDALEALEGMSFEKQFGLGAAQARIDLRYRSLTDAEVHGTARGAQRFIDSAIYDHLMPGLVERVKARATQPAEIQAFAIGNVRFVAVPAEYFVEFGLQIKEDTFPRHTLVVSCANGMVGYLPTPEAMARGGYETTFTMSSRLAREAGEAVAEAAVGLVKSMGA